MKTQRVSFTTLCPTQKYITYLVLGVARAKFNFEELKNFNILGQILLFIFISTVILALPKFSPQTLNCLEF
jgi:hypothetical protein